MCAQIQYASFLIRLWRVRECNGTLAECHSEVEHIQSGETWKFHSLEELKNFFHQSALEPAELTWTEAQAAEQ